MAISLQSSNEVEVEVVSPYQTDHIPLPALTRSLASVIPVQPWYLQVLYSVVVGPIILRTLYSASRDTVIGHPI
jgi:hypothetical protein